MNVKADDLTQVISEAFSFEVVKLPLYAPDNQPTGLYGLFRDDLTGNDSLVGSSSVTSRYVPHTNDDVVALVETDKVTVDIKAEIDGVVTQQFGEV